MCNLYHDMCVAVIAKSGLLVRNIRANVVGEYNCSWKINESCCGCHMLMVNHSISFDPDEHCSISVFEVTQTIKDDI